MYREATEEEIEEAVQSLIDKGLVEEITVNGQKYIALTQKGRVHEEMLAYTETKELN